ncbi:protein ENHANCED DOWNY MILDEW 2 [Cucumis melo var. makuwa]|uniref:Protein ENHANCED DOWNY MILDEW 2 n=1 Tax=Cucumis melo var. makuwa TaxID=1194695 RepID=A0A5D3CCR5_CUCMM|nr:protein ENHANCED DOWNY MILDEW 2 [Cucumis melo var. makuwa]
MLHPENKVAAGDLERKIASGESFSCPVHKCSVCALGENKKIWELQFAVCRRCPKSYHRKCLPRRITFEGSEDGETPTRAWEKLLPNRILIYCLDHEIDEEIETPARDHIKFPGLKESRLPIQKRKLPISDTRQGKTIVFRGSGSRENVVSKKGTMPDDLQGKSAAKIFKSFGRSSSDGKLLGKMTEKSLLGSESKKVKLGNISRNSLNQKGESVLMDIDKTIKVKKSSLVGKSAIPTKRFDQSKIYKEDRSGMLLLDADSERRLMDMMKNVASSITLEDVIKKHKVPSTHAYSLKHVVDKTIKMGKLEGSVVAVRAALRKLEEEGCCIEDAEAVCEPEVLNHIFKWKNKLRVYLAPFLYGMRYSSFGRHFTKVEKLVEIVDRLHWYIEKGNTIVDFCCGANDFSVLMKKKLDETAKQCSFRNFDFIPPKNDFNFEKRDWMTVQPKELPKGSQLIMGLNPPFGVKAALANKFVDKALEFNPKLLILIVPPETERLDKKKTPYDLVWEDTEFLSGKSFYLPGSVDAKDKQMDQWNVRPPVLYLWSRRDWTDKHIAIAQEHGHLWPRKQANSEKEKASDTLRVRQLEESEKGKSSDLLRHGQQEDSGMGKGFDKGKSSDLSRHMQQEDSGMVKDFDKGKSSDLSMHRQQEDSGMGKGSDTSRPKPLESEKGLRSKTSANHIHLHETLLIKDSIILAPDEAEDSKSGSVVSEVPKSESTKTSKRDSDRESHDNWDVHPNMSPEAPRKKRQRFEEIPRKGDGETSEESRRDCKRPLNEIKQRPRASPNASDHTSNKSVEMPSHAVVDGIGHQQLGSTMTEPNTNFRAPYDAAQTSLTDDIARKYNLNAEESYSRGTTGWLNNASSIYGIGPRHVDERIANQMGGHVDGLNYKPYSAGVDTYMRDSEIRSHIHLYGHPDTDNLRSNYQAGPDPRYNRVAAIPSSYGRLGTFPEPSHWMNTSATQRYAPRLDELNHFRLGGMGAVHQMNSSSTFDPRAHTSSGFRGASQGFAPGPQYPYSNQNSAGWLNE